MVKYKEVLGISVDLSYMSIKEVLFKFKSYHNTYTFYVGKGSRQNIQEILARMLDSSEFNIFSPVINIVFEPDFHPFEWCLAAEGEETLGSKSCM